MRLQLVGSPSQGQAAGLSVAGRLDQLETRFDSIEQMVRQLAEQAEARPVGPAAPQGYTTEELAEILGKSSFTIREWARLGRINATKGSARRGGKPEWRVAAAEVDRYRAEGLLPLDLGRNAS